MAGVRVTIPIAGQAAHNSPATPLIFQVAGLPAPQAEAITVINNFCAMMNILYPYCLQVDPAAPGPQQTSTTALTTALQVYTNVFRNALNAFNAPVPATAAWIGADAQLVTLIGLVGGPVPFPANIPAEAPLELFYETILNVQGQNALATGWGAITNAATAVNLGPGAVGRSGVPNVGTIVQGPALAPMLVVTLNQAGYGNWNRMQTWSRNTRNFCIAALTYNNMTTVHQRIQRTEPANAIPNWQDLDQNHWVVTLAGNPANQGLADAAVVNAWTAICNNNVALNFSHLAPPVNSVATAVSFTAHGGDPASVVPVTRARCRRCRVVWRWPMAPQGAGAGYAGPTEPANFNEGPFVNPPSCSEVLMVDKTVRSGLQAAAWA